MTIWKGKSSVQGGSSIREMDCLADRIRLNRQADRRQVIIVEGPSDKRLLERAFPDQDFAYFPAGTRNVALDASKHLAEWNKDYFVCVVDRDFDDAVAEASAACPTIHAYENADVEAMLSVSRAGVDLLLEMGSVGKIDARGGACAVISHLYEILEPISRLRRANVENNWRLAFDAVDLASKIEKRSMTFRLQPYCMALDRESPNSPGAAVIESYATGKSALDSEPSCPRGSSPYFRGRDFLAILGAALCGFCGTKRAQSVLVESLAETLRLAGAYEIRDSQWGRELLTLLKQV